MNENLLTKPEIQQVMERLKTAFPFFTNWEYNNEKNEEYFGFSVWGELVINPKELMPRRFFITIGQHSYLWSSADVGDAHLLDTEPCETLEEAIVVLKAKMLELWRAFSVL